MWKVGGGGVTGWSCDTINGCSWILGPSQTHSTYNDIIKQGFHLFCFWRRRIKADFCIHLPSLTQPLQWRHEYSCHLRNWPLASFTDTDCSIRWWALDLHVWMANCHLPRFNDHFVLLSITVFCFVSLCFASWIPLSACSRQLNLTQQKKHFLECLNKMAMA
jgi:hypothetical protein